MTSFHVQARGAVVGALSNTNLEFQVPVELQDALGQTPQKSSLLWKKRNEEYADYAKGLVPIEVPGQLSVQEGAAMVEVWQQNSSFHSGMFSRSSASFTLTYDQEHVGDDAAPGNLRMYRLE